MHRNHPHGNYWVRGGINGRNNCFDNRNGHRFCRLQHNGVFTVGPLSMSRVHLWGSKMKMPHMHHGHEVMHEAAPKNTYVIYDNEEIARTSESLIGCTEIHRVGKYWSPCKAPDNNK